MEIAHLQKIKLGESYPIIRITFKNWRGKLIKRDVILREGIGWKFIDTNRYSLNDEVLNEFYQSSAFEYTVNGNI